MPATDTAPLPDTTPPSPAAAGKTTGKKVVAQTSVADPIPDAAVEDEAPGKPEPGWFRNTAATNLLVLPDHYPSKRLAPGEATWLPDDPRHPDLERCDPPAPAAEAADTAGSEK